MDGTHVEGSLNEGRRQGRPALALVSLWYLLFLTIPWIESARSRGWIVVILLGLAGAVAGDVLAVRAARADPVRATAALVLSVLPILVWGWVLLVVASGGLQIVS
ncbi:MAG: hypothetical protein ACXVRI_02710 [Gaiellaceae bacterium]